MPPVIPDQGGEGVVVDIGSADGATVIPFLCQTTEVSSAAELRPEVDRLVSDFSRIVEPYLDDAPSLSAPLSPTA
jgi:hypothetical protein